MLLYLLSRKDLLLVRDLPPGKGYTSYQNGHITFHRRVIPPTRMVTSGVGGPTYRLGLFLDSVLKPVVDVYCKGEVVKDSTDFIKELMRMEKSGVSKSMNLIGTLDVVALYPSIRLDIALEALEDALNRTTIYSNDQVKMILCMARICIENSVIHYRGKWYCSKRGIPTGGPESGSIANIVVFFVLTKKLLIHPEIHRLNKISIRKRFLDDVWCGWLGTSREFSLFLAAMNRIGSEVYMELPSQELSDLPWTFWMCLSP